MLTVKLPDSSHVDHYSFNAHSVYELYSWMMALQQTMSNGRNCVASIVCTAEQPQCLLPCLRLFELQCLRAFVVVRDAASKGAAR